MARAPRRITAPYLERVTAHYLERYGANRAHLRRLLARRVERSARHHAEEPEEIDELRTQGLELVDAELDRLERIGLLNDARYASDKARAMHRRGASSRKIRAKLRERGLSAAVIDEALAALAPEGGNLDLVAAATFARKRRLGPWRRQQADRERRAKELARLGRAGFPYDIARQVVDAESIEAITE